MWEDQTSSLELSTLRNYWVKTCNIQITVPINVHTFFHVFHFQLINSNSSSVFLYQNTLVASSSALKDELMRSPTKNVWFELAKVCLARITIFNKRRGEEPSKLLLTTYQQRKNGQHNTELVASLTSVEKELVKKYA